MEQDVIDFLKKHRNADDITVDTVTGLPVSATYKTLNGILRRFPVTYRFADMYADPYIEPFGPSTRDFRIPPK